MFKIILGLLPPPPPLYLGKLHYGSRGVVKGKKEVNIYKDEIRV